jgi:hypothetical protein
MEGCLKSKSVSHNSRALRECSAFKMTGSDRSGVFSMTRMSFKAVADLVALGAVVLSLVFVGLQIRQNNRMARAAAYQALGLHASDIWAERSHDPSLAALVVASKDTAKWASIDEVGWERLRSMHTAYLRGAEAIFRQIQEGLLSSDALATLGYQPDYIVTNPAFQRLWPELKTRTSEDFAAYIERRMHEVRATAPVQ